MVPTVLGRFSLNVLCFVLVPRGSFVWWGTSVSLSPRMIRGRREEMQGMEGGGAPVLPGDCGWSVHSVSGSGKLPSGQTTCWTEST